MERQCAGEPPLESRGAVRDLVAEVSQGRIGVHVDWNTIASSLEPTTRAVSSGQRRRVHRRVLPNRSFRRRTCDSGHRPWLFFRVAAFAVGGKVIIDV